MQLNRLSKNSETLLCPFLFPMFSRSLPFSLSSWRSFRVYFTKFYFIIFKYNGKAYYFFKEIFRFDFRQDIITDFT